MSLHPLERADEAWQRVEAWLCTALLVVEVAALALWIVLRGLSSDYEPGGSAAGLVCRAFLSAVLLGSAVHLLTRRAAPAVHRTVVTGAVVLGLFVLGRLWVHAGVHWASNALNFLQNASCLMLVGGLRGLATRLTLWVGLLGASMATSRGKHIHVDVFVRLIPERLRPLAAAVGWVAAASFCATAAAGFVDYIGVAEYRVSASSPCPGEATRTCDTPAGEKLGQMKREMAGDVFLLGRQLSLDLKSWPRVLRGVPYDTWMSAAEWNQWLGEADWSSRYDASAVAALHADESDPKGTHMPAVVVPGTGEQARGLLIRDANLVFPFGLAAIAAKLLLRAILALTGSAEAEPGGAGDDESLEPSLEPDVAAGAAE